MKATYSNYLSVYLRPPIKIFDVDSCRGFFRSVSAVSSGTAKASWPVGFGVMWRAKSFSRIPRSLGECRTQDLPRIRGNMVKHGETISAQQNVYAIITYNYSILHL